MEEKEEVVFAYLYGSLLDAPFRDIDIAVYVDESRADDPLGLAIPLSLKIERAIRLTVDVSMINSAPLRAVHRMIKGRLILSRDDGLRFRFIERALVECLDFEPAEDRMIEEVLR